MNGYLITFIIINMLRFRPFNEPFELISVFLVLVLPVSIDFHFSHQDISSRMYWSEVSLFSIFSLHITMAYLFSFALQWGVIKDSLGIFMIRHAQQVSC